MVSVYVTLTNDEVKNIDEVEVNEVDQSDNMIYEVNKNGNNMMVDRSEDKFPKVTTEVTGSSAFIGEDDEGSHEVQAAFTGKLSTFYREKGMEFKPPMSYGYGDLRVKSILEGYVSLSKYHTVNLKLERGLDVQVVDVGPPADWVKINVRATNDSFEVYALVPGLLRDELRVQSDPTGCLVITGQQHQLDNPWGVTSFKKVVTLPARIDQLRTNAVLTFHGCLHVHVPFAQQNL
ncbi:AT-rich interactive domain-containing protein 6-like [Solanum lycopersicum]|uniref:AT-rich interactive domain-containing protein 6-like n=1 Tax=Solanum lycopersicum TaxID=4081 RepID=UPI0008FEB40C|nr:AT-rich interactive domain-containing protein 6-like [Solanum lycopersicum]